MCLNRPSSVLECPRIDAELRPDCFEKNIDQQDTWHGTQPNASNRLVATRTETSIWHVEKWDYLRDNCG